MNIPIKGRVRVCFSLISSLDLKEKVLLDIGCSNGWLLSLLKERNLKKGIGLDPSPKEIALARKNASWAKFYISQANKLPLEKESVDIVCLFDVLEHLPRGLEKQTLREIGRVLRKKGKLFLSTPNSNFLANILDPAWYLGHRHYTVSRLKALLESCGYHVNKMEIRGGFWSLIYMLWFYFSKIILRNKFPRNIWLEKKDDGEYSKTGICTIFTTAS